MILYGFFSLFFCVLTWTKSNSGSNEHQQMALDYFKQYAYMGEKNPDVRVKSMPDEVSYPLALRMFQSMYDLPVTGVLDNETKALMSRPRCGVPDILVKEDMDITQLAYKKKRRNRKYIIQGSKWLKNDLTYAIDRYTPDLPKKDLLDEISRAFAIWENPTPLKFTKVSSPSEADIVIQFAEGDHGDGKAFDGKGGIMAHAFFPQADSIGGDTHFDDAEEWTQNTKEGANLFQVAAHEFGHSLGLRHSKNKDALMAPFYRKYDPNFQLHMDDIIGIQSIYGPAKSDVKNKQNTMDTFNPIPDPIDYQLFCSAAKFDAVTEIMFNSKLYTFAFYKDLYAQIDENGIVDYYPKKISEGWPGLKSNLDAAFYQPPTYTIEKSADSKIKRVQTSPAITYFFKGSKFWKNVEGKFLDGYPREISSEWKGLPDDIDAAFTWSKNGKVYVIKGDQYYKLKANSMIVEPGYPQSLSLCCKSLEKVDAALSYGGKTFFFTGREFYQFDDQLFAIDPDYPKSNDKWLKCNKADDLIKAMNDASIVNRKVSVMITLNVVLTIMNSVMI